ncbi:MAG TPA: DUF2491 family protein [Sneathiellales bacterium]|jgi:hypothetical protein|nr:DUF2491 family protein [Sneathiellales bacterium]
MLGSAMKSLFKSGARNLKNKLSKADEEDEFPTPLGLRIGAAVDIDTLPLRMNADDLHVELPEETLIIVAQGYVDLGDSTHVHRYYTADDIMVQVMTVAGMEDQHVEELTLFVPFQSYYPEGDGAWAQWTSKGGKLGALVFKLDDGTQFSRIWFDMTEGYAEPVEFTESVYEDPDSDECGEVFHKVMLYGRNLEVGKKNEYLLVSVEAYKGEQTVELMVGVDLEIANMKVI